MNCINIYELVIINRQLKSFFEKMKIFFSHQLAFSTVNYAVSTIMRVLYMWTNNKSIL